MEVRGLIEEGTRVALQYLQPMTGNGFCCAVGFSWGGGVLHRMIADQHWIGPTLLLCPATGPMAKVGGVDLPPPLIPNVAKKVILIAARGDIACGAEVAEEFRKLGATGQVVEDGHNL